MILKYQQSSKHLEDIKHIAHDWKGVWYTNISKKKISTNFGIKIPIDAQNYLTNQD